VTVINTKKKKLKKKNRAVSCVVFEQTQRGGQLKIVACTYLFLFCSCFLLDGERLGGCPFQKLLQANESKQWIGYNLQSAITTSQKTSFCIVMPLQEDSFAGPGAANYSSPPHHHLLMGLYYGMFVIGSKRTSVNVSV
jgi:hypothetical protein